VRDLHHHDILGTMTALRLHLVHLFIHLHLETDFLHSRHAVPLRAR